MNGKGGRQGKWKERGERINTVAASTGKAGKVEAALMQPRKISPVQPRLFHCPML